MPIKIPDLYIRVKDQNFATANLNSNFIGRKEIRDRIKRRLNPKFLGESNSQKYCGAYLVAGYRGMGKSTLVNKVISEINEKQKEAILDIPVFLSQGELSDYDLLRQMFIQFRSKVLSLNRHPLDRYINLISLFSATVFLPMILLLIVVLLMFSLATVFFPSIPFPNVQSMILFIWLFGSQIQDLVRECMIFLVEFELISTSVFLVLLFSLYLLIKNIIEHITGIGSDLLSKISAVNQRIHSALEIAQSNEFADHSASSQSSSSINIPLSIFNSEKQSSSKQSFQKLTAKELEFELKEILDLFSKERRKHALKSNTSRLSESRKKASKNNVVFIIDELDKLEPEFAAKSVDYLDLGKTRLENRKEKIISLLANLKSFIHTSEAKFVFIGGAEIYEATLADIADRESFYSSIFDEVFYLDTFFKDQVDERRKGISQMVDYYLLKRVFPSDSQAKFRANDVNYSNYLSFYDRLSGLEVKTVGHAGTLDVNSNQVKKDFVMYQINRFLVYLTYRSNGSPKKLKSLIEHNIVDFNSSSLECLDPKKLKRDALILDFDSSENKSYVLYDVKEEIPALPSGQFLRIRFDLQFKTGVHTSIFLPFLINTENHLKRFNDKNLYLAAFLLDHILKFHKSAFSWRELELMPDIIIGSKGPSLRDMMDEIISFLSVKHIRETTNAMFQFKFRSRTAMELRYLSKISNESAAAFNFTYDESEHLKSFFKRKLKQKIEANRDNRTINDGKFNHTISYLNSLIADLHFYDEEYGSAVRYYSDSIQSLRETEYIANNHQKMLFTRDRLLLSLCLEKSKQYGSAYSVIRSLLIDISGYDFNFPDSSRLTELEDPYKRMQLFLRPHLSLLMVIEKNRSDGVTLDNLKRNIKEYSQFMGLRALFPFEKFKLNFSIEHELDKVCKKGDSKRIETLLADYYQSVGSILFYKNKNYPSLYEDGAEGILNKRFNLRGFNTENNEVEVLEYLKFSKVRNHFNIFSQFYFPSFSSFFYYSISLDHLLRPYFEYSKFVFGDDCEFSPEDSLSATMRFLEKLAYDYSAVHILGGKQKELIGLILSKLSDSIFSCLGGTDSFKIYTSEPDFRLLLEDVSVPSWEKHCEIKCFNQLFNVLTVLYFNLLSYRFYRLADKPYDALFVLKKCLYILNAHDIDVKVKNDTYDEHGIDSSRFSYQLKNWLQSKSSELINSNSISLRNRERPFFNSVTRGEFISDSLLYNEDEIEIRNLDSKYTLIYGDSEIMRSKFIDEINLEKINSINSAFLRVQQLKYRTEIIFRIHKNFLNRVYDWPILSVRNREHYTDELKAFYNGVFFPYIDPGNSENECVFFSHLEEIVFCYTEIVNTINSYGVNFSMSNCYMASVYRHLSVWSYVMELLAEMLSISIFFDSIVEDHISGILIKRTSLFNHKANIFKGIEYYERSISFHSEGQEYKKMIQEMYILEDDLNDSQTHFFVSLERSILNSGKIEKYLKSLRERAELKFPNDLFERSESVV